MPNQVRIGVGVTGAKGAASELDGIRDRFDKMRAQGAKGFAIGAAAGATTFALGAMQSALGGAVGAIQDSITAASDMNETLQKSQVVFGDASGGIEKFGRGAALSMGLSENAAIGAAASIGNLLRSTGTAPAEIAPMSTALVKLASDLASFNNISVEDALAKLQSGIVGQERPLRELGVAISAASVDAEALTLGFKKVNGVFTEGEKVQARYALIFKQTGTAQGDFARTSTAMANQQRELNAELENTSVKVGGKVVPIVIDGQRAIIGLSAATDLLTDSSKFAAAEQEDLAHTMAKGLLGLGPFANWLGSVSLNMMDFGKAAVLTADQVAQAADSNIGSIERTRGAFGRESDGIMGSLGDMKDAAWDWRHALGRDAGAVIRSFDKVRNAMADDAQGMIDGYFDPVEKRAALHDVRLQVLADQDALRTSKTAEDARQARDDIAQSLDDEASALVDLSKTGDLTKQDVANFTTDAHRSFQGMSKGAIKDVLRIIDQLNALANMPNIHKTVTIDEIVKVTKQDQGSKNDTHGKGHGKLEFDTGGMVDAPAGVPVDATLHGKEMVLTEAQQRAVFGSGARGGGDTYNYNIYPQGRWDVDKNSVAEAVRRLRAISTKRAA